MDRKYTGPELLALRKRALLSQKEVVKLTGVTEPTIAYLEMGRTKPHGGTILKLLSLYAERIQKLEDIYGVLDGKTPVRTCTLEGE